MGVGNSGETVAVDSQDDIIIGAYGEASDKELIKYNPSGNIIWDKEGYSSTLAVNSNDEIIIRKSSKICMLTPDGDEGWCLSFVDGYAPKGIAVDSEDNIVVGGDKSGGYGGIIVKYGYAQPDLTITRIWFNENPCCAGDDVEIIFDVTNRGDCDAGSHTDCLYIDGNKVTEFSSSGLNAGDTTGWYYLYENVPSTPNPHVIEVCTDCNNDVEESEEGNNCDSDNLNVVTPIMTVNPTSWNPTIICGNSDSEIVTVSASGGCPVNGVTVSKVSGPTWLSVSPTNLGDIASGSSKTFTMTAAPPSETSGDFTYTVRVSNTCGIPSSIDVTGTITVQCGELQTFITTDKYEYHPGDTMTITLDIENPTASSVDTYFVLLLRLPEYSYQKLMLVTRLTLPPFFDQTYNTDIYVGNWAIIGFNAEWYVAVLETSAPYDIICDDTAEWRYDHLVFTRDKDDTSKGGSAPAEEVVPEKIAEAIMKSIGEIALPVELVQEEEITEEILDAILD